MWSRLQVTIKGKGKTSTVYEGTLVGGDSNRDIAVLKVRSKPELFHGWSRLNSWDSPETPLENSMPVKREVIGILPSHCHLLLVCRPFSDPSFHHGLALSMPGQPRCLTFST
jgi:hypothetical protein